MPVVNLSQILTFAAEKGASDIHFQVGAPPLLRHHGELFPLKHPPLSEEDMVLIGQTLAKYDDSEKFKKEVKDYDGSFALANVARFRVNVFRQNGRYGAVLRLIPFKARNFEELNLPKVLEKIRPAEARADPGHRRHGQRQVHHPGGHHQFHQHEAARPHHHHRGPDRVPLREEPVDHLAARDRPRHRVVRLGPAGGHAPGPRRDHGGRTARPPDRRHLPEGRRDRPPGHGLHPHPGRHAHPEPPPGLFPGRGAPLHPPAPVGGPGGHRLPAAAAQPGQDRHVSRPARSCW